MLSIWTTTKNLSFGKKLFSFSFLENCSEDLEDDDEDDDEDEEDGPGLFKYVKEDLDQPDEEVS